MPTHARASFSILLAALLASPASFAFQSPLSDEAVREAYFLGQRHDGSFPRLLDKYSKRLPTPNSGPTISGRIFKYRFSKGMRSACQPISPVNQPSSAPATAIIAI